MIVNQLMAKLRSEQKAGNGKLELRMFAHDQDPEDHEECDGDVRICEEYTNDIGETFIALKA